MKIMTSLQPLHCDILHGRSEEVLKTMPSNSVDSIVCDPPYELASNIDVRAMIINWMKGRRREARGHLGLAWDVIPGPDLWEECLRVLKPGGHLLASSHARTYQYLALAIEFAGFEVRDQLQWLYGQGQVLSVNVAKVSGDPSLEGVGTGLTPGHEPIVLARKPPMGNIVQCIQKFGTGGMNLGECKTAGGRYPKNVILSGEAIERLDHQAGVRRSGSPGKRTKAPSNVARGKDTRKIGSQNVGYGDCGGASRFFYCAKPSVSEREAGTEHLKTEDAEVLVKRKPGSAGIKSGRAGAGRTSEGRSNTHATVKPIALMRYLIRLITPPGGVVLDPFFGSGTTGCAAAFEGRHCIGIEMLDEHIDIAEARVCHFHKQERGVDPLSHRYDLVTSMGRPLDTSQLPLFMGECAL